LKLQEALGDAEYRRLLNKAKDARPAVPAWDGKSDNTDDWKHKSAMQEGFDLCLATFGIQL